MKGAKVIAKAIFAVPEEICVMQYARATLDYSKRSSNAPTALREIHFIDKNRNIVQQIQDVFSSILRYGREPTYNKQKYVKPHPSYTPRADHSRFYNEDERRNARLLEIRTLVERAAGCHSSKMSDQSCSVVCYDHYVSPETKWLNCRVGAQCMVSVYRADIVTLKDVHICVCSDDSHGNGKGVVSRKLGKAAGKAHTDDKRKIFKKNQKEGSVVTTYGGKLSFKRIFYAVLPHHPVREERKQLLSQMFLNMLDESEKIRAESLALPTLGLGSNPSKDDIQAWIQIFMEIYCNFSMQQKRPFTVHIVCNENYLTSQVQAALRQFQPPQTSQVATQLSPTRQWTEGEQKPEPPHAYKAKPSWSDSAKENDSNRDMDSDEDVW